MMEPIERPTTPLSVKLVGVGVLVVLGWLLFGSALSVARAAIALFGYVVVAVVAFMLGRATARRTRD